MSKLLSSVMGPVLLWSTRREDQRLARGVTYEPPTILERRNWELPVPRNAHPRRESILAAAEAAVTMQP